MKRSKESGFTLVELAISMIIIGLLIVSILAGQSLIKAAKIRAVVNEVSDYQTSYNLFQQTYGSKPGDIPDITDLVPGIAAPGRNGNGQGDIVWNAANTCSNSVGGAAVNCSEGATAWRHLTMVGMASGIFTGLVVANFADIDLNIPASKFTPAGYAIDYDAVLGRNFLRFAAETAAGINATAVLAPTDARDIDSKADDGDPANGVVQDSGAANCSAAGAYKLDEGETVRCGLDIYIDPI